MSNKKPSVVTTSNSGYGAMGNSNIQWATLQAPSMPGITVDANDPDTLIMDGTVKIDDTNLNECIKHVSKRLSIIIPDTEDLEKHPALKAAYEDWLRIVEKLVDPQLKAAYEQYQIIEKLIKENNETL